MLDLSLFQTRTYCVETLSNHEVEAKTEYELSAWPVPPVGVVVWLGQDSLRGFVMGSATALHRKPCLILILILVVIRDSDSAEMEPWGTAEHCTTLEY